MQWFLHLKDNMPGQIKVKLDTVCGDPAPLSFRSSARLKCGRSSLVDDDGKNGDHNQ